MSPKKAAKKNAVQRKVSQHPNATAAGSSGALATLLVYGAQQLGVDISPELAAAIVAGVTTVVLAIGRRRAH
jgi:hypothetical protein